MECCNDKCVRCGAYAVVLLTVAGTILDSYLCSDCRVPDPYLPAEQPTLPHGPEAPTPQQRVYFQSTEITTPSLTASLSVSSYLDGLLS